MLAFLQLQEGTADEDRAGKSSQKGWSTAQIAPELRMATISRTTRVAFARVAARGRVV
jgi:hypothetical protein